MKVADGLTAEVIAHLFMPDERQRVVGTNKDIQEVADRHRHLFVAVEGLFSGLQTNRCKRTDAIVADTIAFKGWVVAMARYLGKCNVKFVVLLTTLTHF